MVSPCSLLNCIALVLHGFLSLQGITQSLAEVKGKYQEMSLEHNKLAQKFRKDVEALETIFVSATKSTK